MQRTDVLDPHCMEVGGDGCCTAHTLQPLPSGDDSRPGEVFTGTGVYR